jgi:hypothetical protein
MNGAAGNCLGTTIKTCDNQLLFHLPSAHILLRQCRGAAGSGLGTGLGTTTT